MQYSYSTSNSMIQLRTIHSSLTLYTTYALKDFNIVETYLFGENVSSTRCTMLATIVVAKLLILRKSVEQDTWEYKKTDEFTS